MFIFLIVTSLLARAKQGKSLLPADCPCVIKVFHSKEVITGLCFLGKLIHSTWLKKYSWPEIRSLGNYTFGEKKNLSTILGMLAWSLSRGSDQHR